METRVLIIYTQHIHTLYKLYEYITIFNLNIYVYVYDDIDESKTVPIYKQYNTVLCLNI